MTFKQLQTNKVVLYARLLGFQPFGETLHARSHFHWFMPDADDTFTLRFHRRGGMGYTVNRQTTSSVDRACEWLKEIEAKRAGLGQEK